MLIDCMGDEPRRELNGHMMQGSHVLVVSCPWNYGARRVENINKTLQSVQDMLRYSNRQVRKVFVFCKKGERRSAAVLMVIMCEIFNFTRNAAKSQIEDTRHVAKLTTSYENGFRPTWVEVNELLDERQEWAR